jgi:uncharacterized Tic20 family protein
LARYYRGAELTEPKSDQVQRHEDTQSAVDFRAIENDNKSTMKALILFIGWCILFVLCWPLALLALILFPLVWLISLPLRLIGITLEAVFALLRAVLFLPARLLGSRKSKGRAA